MNELIKLVSKHVSNSFSYPRTEEDVILKAEKLALQDGKTLSQLIVHLLKQEVKKEVGLEEGPLLKSRPNLSFTLDSFTDVINSKEKVTFNNWRHNFKQLEDQQTLDKFMRLGQIMSTEAKNRIQVLKAGRENLKLT